jgi:chaperonin GroES
MGFTPISNNVLIKLEPEPKDKMTAGGIYLPDQSANPFPMKGEVVSVGAGKLTEKGKLMPMSFKSGDTVVFGQYAGVELIIDDDKHIIIAENQLLGVLIDE